ncbi:uncharacterized protein [Eurosta solidaginis]|uniref:uncharacterized protein isoform X2 n=1 Tax=Eurosta solidaginis TaxID=178769 RepID=UPI00353172E1
MGKCAICSKRCERGTGPFFQVPSDDQKRLLWENSCRMYLRNIDLICADHFSRGDMICGGRKARLLPKAVPFPDSQSVASANCTPTVHHEMNIDTSPAIQDPVYTNSLAGSVNATLNAPSSKSFAPIDLNNTTSMQAANTQKDQLINEALFDHEESAKQPNIIAEIKTEDDDPLFGYNTCKGTQTDEPSEDRINCGFINVSKTGADKYFNLRCFYCDTEFPITFWSEFSDHIIYDHKDLENKYNKSVEHTSITSEHNTNNDIDEMDASESMTEEELPPIDFINLNHNKSNDSNCASLMGDVDVSTLKESIAKYANVIFKAERYVPFEPKQPQQEDVYGTNYELNIEHNYSQIHANQTITEDIINNADEPVDEISFENSPRDIILDFFNNIKGLPGLWLDRKLHPFIYDRELKDLMEIMQIRWNLNLRLNNLRKNWETIKEWFHTMRTARKMDGSNYFRNIFSEYYDICEEFLTFAEPNNPNSRCDRCNHKALNASRLQVHKYSKHKIGLPPYKCNKCSKYFIYIDNMLKHIRKHVENTKTVEETEKDLKCYECNQNFTSTTEYKLHLDKHPKGDCPYACEECGNRYKDMAKRNAHQRGHKIRYPCELCPAILTNRTTFKNHVNSHKGIYEYICEWCGRPFVSRNKWWQHVKFAHMGHGLCKICNREYKKASILQKHLRNLHRPTFGTVEELALRGRRKGGGGANRGKFNLMNRKYEYVIDPVTKERRLKCPKCDKSFIRHRNVCAHTLKVHNYDMRNLPRGKWQKSIREKFLNSNNFSDKKTAAASATEAAVNTITESPVTKVEISEGDSNDQIENVVCIATDDDDINTTGIYFEKLVDEITTDKNQSGSNFLDEMYNQSSEKVVAPSVAVLEDSERTAFEFVLNTDGRIINYYLENK